ncbi:hypothetical protein PIB30_022946 [Stylosanthes scabra]|uniref:Uncharacterized protein n=1 Tax=Stylosanthes scabra TaxID=79078 RepID=A0ABU6R9M1_9FABA|nr:hypothetical protein [Stylosanthes scabra]
MTVTLLPWQRCFLCFTRDEVHASIHGSRHIISSPDERIYPSSLRGHLISFQLQLWRLAGMGTNSEAENSRFLFRGTN